MKKIKWFLLSLVLVLVAGLVAACAPADGEESPDDCFPDEVYDEVDKFCYPAVDCEGGDCESYNFYYDNATMFVTDYAATSPEEDIAEAWAYFILKPKPEGNTVAEQKVLFFYEWDELTKLRAQVVSRTYSRLRRK